MPRFIARTTGSDNYQGICPLNSKLRKVTITALAVGWIGCLDGFLLTTQGADNNTSAPETREQTREQRHRRVVVERRGDSSRDHDNDRGRDRRHYDPEAVKRFMKAELEHVPGLNERMERLIRIQAERQDLQKQRQAVAAKPDRNKSATIEKFHSLLRRDFALSDESRKIAREIVADLPGIKKQLNVRKDSLEKELESANQAAPDPTTSSPEASDVRRKIRYVDFLDKKLSDLEDHPERLDLLTRLLRGVPFDESREMARTPEAHLTELQTRRQKLQRELRQIENEIQLIKAKGIKAAPDDPAEKAR